MNMKKSIAGVMAGAMAVSAMATVVSADQDAISLTYDLKTYVNQVNKTSAKVTVVANYEGSQISEDSVKDGYIDFGVNNGFITGGNLYNKNGVVIGGFWKKDDNGKDVADPKGFMKEFEFTARPYKDVINDLEEKYQTYKATGYADNVDGAFYRKELDDGVTVFSMPIGAGNNVYGKFDLTKYDLYTLGYTTGNGEAALGIGFGSIAYDGKFAVGKDLDLAVKYDSDKEIYYVVDKYADLGVKCDSATGEITADPHFALYYVGVDQTTYAVRDAVAKMTYEIPNTVSVNQANGWGWGGDYWNWAFWPAPTQVDENQINNIALEYFGISTYGDVTMTADLFTKGFWTSTAGTKKGLIWNAHTLVSDPTTVSVGAFTAGAAEEAVIPFKSALKPESHTWTVKDAKGVEEKVVTKDNDVIWALQSRKAGGNYYTRPVAVINDAIANHDNVVFTFTSYNGYVGTEKSHIMNQWVNVDQGYTYQTSSYDWYNPTFGQHLYTNVADGYSLFDSNEYDMYGSYSSAWGINLFTGAVVVNKDLTMQLNDTDTFNWGNNTLSFDWFDIIDEGKITDAKTFLTSMLLYTPVDWYWDSLTVVVTDDEEEDIDAGEGLDGEGDVIDDEEPEEIVDEPEIEEEPEVVETEAAPVETAPSPATGNAPVALAVIPVALAAAAVVAKKRG